MKKREQWQTFEDLTQQIFEKMKHQSNIVKIERNVKVHGIDGSREIDIFVTSMLGNFEIRTVVECKNHSSKVSIGTIDELESKMRDVRANKAILVSRSGFSSKAIAKAKRVGISLCTAHQALSPNWKIDIEIPIVVREVTPHQLKPSLKFLETRKVRDNDFEFSRDFLSINGANIFEVFTEQWNANKIKYSLTEDPQVVEISTIRPPYFTTNVKGEKIPLKEFSVEITLAFRYYLSNITELENTQLLKYITEGVATFFIDFFPIANYQTLFKKINKDSIPKSHKFVLDVLMVPAVSQYKMETYHFFNDKQQVRTIDLRKPLD